MSDLPSWQQCRDAVTQIWNRPEFSKFPLDEVAAEDMANILWASVNPQPPLSDEAVEYILSKVLAHRSSNSPYESPLTEEK